MKVQEVQTFMLLRHAQSTQNKHKKQLKTNTNQLNQVDCKFSSQYFDAELSEKGRQQAKQLGLKIFLKWRQQIGGVVVSPLLRALETTQIVLKTCSLDEVKVWVQPLLTEGFYASCDVGSKLSSSIQIYEKRYDFSRLKSFQLKNWWLQILSHQIREQIEKISQKTNVSLAEATLTLMKQKNRLKAVVKLNKDVVNQKRNQNNTKDNYVPRRNYWQLGIIL